MKTTATAPDVDGIVDGYLRDEPVSADLPGGGRLRLDRRLPYLLYYREPEGGGDEALETLLAGEASYAVLAAEATESSRELLLRLAEAGAETFGAFLLLEVWPRREHEHTFRILGPRGEAPATVEALRAGLEEIRSIDPLTQVRVEGTWERHPPDLPPLLSITECHELGCLLLGLEVPAIYRGDDGVVYPLFLRALRRAFYRVLRRSLFEFVRVQSRTHAASWRVLGRRTLDEAVWQADARLAEIERGYDLLMLVSPVDEEEAWVRFQERGFQENPSFHYRLLPIDPDLVKRRLYEVPLERVSDPAAAYLLRDKREQIDRQVSLLAERGSPTFLHSSIRVYGAVEGTLLDVAHQVLEELPSQPPRREATASAPGATAGGPAHVDAAAFRDAAEREVARYRATWPELGATVRVRPDFTGLMVSRGHLMIGASLRIPRERLEPLIHHEVGTHVLTFWNGRAQPLEQLAYGLADYDEFQEGLAVFAEYLVDGLTVARMRLIAARVLAAHAVEHGAEFIETFRLLSRDHGFSPAASFGMSTRVHAGGGFTRDLIYLRGVLDLLDHLQGGGALETLYIGKLARRHVDVVEELRDRGVLRAPPLRPRFLDFHASPARLDAARAGLPLTAMVRARRESDADDADWEGDE